MYSFIRRILFLFPAEWAHYFSMNCFRILCSVELIRQSIYKLSYLKKRELEIPVFHLSFKNPVGLGAGFDKNALFLRELEALGFGFV